MAMFFSPDDFPCALSANSGALGSMPERPKIRQATKEKEGRRKTAYGNDFPTALT
jgi:hypothetical protein